LFCKQVGSTKPVLKHYGALPGLNLEENFDLGQHPTTQLAEL